MDPQQMDKLAARYAPILKFAENEHFFPMDVQDYISKCSLHIWDEPDEHRMLQPAGSIALDDIAQWPQKEYFLVYAEEEYTIPEEKLVSAHALADVGAIARKLIRKITDGALPKPCQKAKTLYGQDQHKPVFYYRILNKRERGGNVDIIQYFFFYAFNDWATTHEGVNDHEADWERVCVFFEDFNDAQPSGVAYSAHSEHFWRRWKEVEVHAGEDRPVVYVDGGSHANLPSKKTSKNAKWPLKFLREIFKRGGIINWRPGEVVIGFSKTQDWHEPILKPLPDVEPVVEQNWVNNFKGLWGARYYWDVEWYFWPFVWIIRKINGTKRPGGAPGGPMYGNDGKVREDWLHPETWYGD